MILDCPHCHKSLFWKARIYRTLSGDLKIITRTRNRVPVCVYCGDELAPNVHPKERSMALNVVGPVIIVVGMLVDSEPLMLFGGGVLLLSAVWASYINFRYLRGWRRYKKPDSLCYD